MRFYGSHAQWDTTVYAENPERGTSLLQEDEDQQEMTLTMNSPHHWSKLRNIYICMGFCIT